MKIARVTLESASPYGQSRYYQDPPKEKGEAHDEYEKRTWMQRCHFDSERNVFIPPMCFKKSLDAAAAYRGDKITGKGAKTWKKKFESGIMVLEGLEIGYHCPLPGTEPSNGDVKGMWLHLPSDGVAGGGKRVLKRMPYVEEWSGVVDYHILDDEIDKDTFANHLETAGMFIGLGYWRPERRGIWGRFKVVKVDWEKVS